MRLEISKAMLDRLQDRLVVASVSGGKDSTALALLLGEAQVPHVRVFADTGFEAPETYEYLDRIRERLGPIDVVRNEGLWQEARGGEEGMLTLIRRKQMFPSRLMRFCTQQLKLRPIRDYVRTLQDRGHEVVNAVGVRAEESAARAQMAEWEFWSEMDAEIWRPLLAWSEQDVIEMHRRHNLAPNPMYLSGARRVGCFPCIYARKKDLRLLPAEQIARIRHVEDDLTADANARGCERPTRAFFQIRGQDGRLQFTPIDEVVKLAHLHRGRPIEAESEPAGCVRWGLCEASPIEAEQPRRVIGHDHLKTFGATQRMIERWLAEGVLRSTADPDFYERTPALDERLATKRVIGRGHLLAMGLTKAAITGWLRLGTLERTSERGFYRITQVALEGLRLETGAPPPDSRSDEPQDPEPTDSPESTGPAVLEPTRPPGDSLQIIPCTLRRARAFCAEHHRHHGAPVGGLFALGLAQAGELVGVAVVGRPVARALQDGATAEVTRVCTLGEPNACSKLLGACRRVARDLGYRRLVTYTLSEEPGTSLRAAGWIQTASVPGRSWDRRTRRRTTTSLGDKRRWEVPLPAARGARP